MGRRKIVGSLMIALIVGGAAWAWFATRTDAHVAKAEAISEKIFAENNGPPDFTKPEVREKFEELRTEVESMSEETRGEFMRGQRERMQSRMEDQFDRYLAMNPEEKQAELDRIIDQMEGMRKRFAEERARRERESDDNKQKEGDRPPRRDRDREGGPGPPPGGPLGPPPPGGPGAGGPGRGPGFGPPPFAGDPTKRNERRKEMLDATSPQFRAKAQQFAKDMFARMRQRGITPPFPMPPL